MGKIKGEDKGVCEKVGSNGVRRGGNGVGMIKGREDNGVSGKGREEWSE